MDNNTIEFTSKEKGLLKMLLSIANIIIETQGGYIEQINDEYDSMDRNELYNLSVKLGVDYY